MEVGVWRFSPQTIPAGFGSASVRMATGIDIAEAWSRLPARLKDRLDKDVMSELLRSVEAGRIAGEARLLAERTSAGEG